MLTKETTKKKGKGVNKQEIEFMGIKFKSAKDLCKQCDLPLELYRERLSKGWSLERTLTTPKNGRGKRRLIVFKDKIYPSLYAFAKVHNLKYNLFLSALSEKKSYDECLMNPELKLKDGENFKDFNSGKENNKYNFGFPKKSNCTVPPSIPWSNVMELAYSVDNTYAQITN